MFNSASNGSAVYCLGTIIPVLRSVRNIPFGANATYAGQVLRPVGVREFQLTVMSFRSR